MFWNSKGGGGGDCSAFLRWLRSKSGTHISSVLSLGTSSAFGRSLFASKPIQEGDCIMQVPYHVQLTLDKLPQKFNTLLDHAVGDTSKLAALLIMEQHLGNESGWAPYIKSLPTKDQMHNMVLWDLNELHAVQNSSIYDEAIEHKEQAKKEFLALKPALDHFPHLFGEVKLGDFMHASALDFLNHDGVFGSVLIYDEQKNVCEIIADRNYAVGEQVMIRYGKYSNATLALNFGFTLARNIYDQALIRIDMPVQDPLYKKKLDIWQKHRLPIFEDMCNLSPATSFVIKEVKSSQSKGIGIPLILRAFLRVFSAMSLEELEEMAMEAAESDGRLARCPLKNMEREIHAHRRLLLHFAEMIQGHSAAIEQLEIVDGPASRSMHPFRKEMAKDLLVGELRVLERETNALDFGEGEGGRDRGGRMLQRAASNAYSWWWASHIRTKQSKWLDSHLQDMEHRVKCMLLLLGEEADSFSKRAEMYYKRRPEVITQVEEVYRAYRGLADRYDIISGELHKANHTIATAFPDQVQYAMLEEEDDNIPKAFTPVDPRKIHKSTVDGLMKKKKGGEQPAGSKNKNTTSAPIDKDNAREEISRLQKEILVMQTEKEFIKSSYESGIAKYWDLEKQINEMQEQVCHFQDKFDESAVIEDDEARALMTATALKSCEDTIVKLQEQRKTSASQAMGESERVKVLREKLKAVMEGHGKSLPDCPDPCDKNVRKNHGFEMEEVQHIKLGEFETQTVLEKIKEHFERDGSISVAEITEHIDELVNKVVDLELMVSSQSSQIDRLCRENSELESCLQSLEEENASDPDEVNEKLKKLEEELVRVQALESCFHKDESTIRSNFSEAISRLSGISEMLQTSEHGVGGTLAVADGKEEEEEEEDNDAGGMDDVAEPQVQTEAASDDVDPAGKSTADVDPAGKSTATQEEEAQAVDVGQEKAGGCSRERGSLVRLRHISSDDLGGCDDEAPAAVDDADGMRKQKKGQEGEGVEEEKKVILVAEYRALLEENKDAKRRLAEVEKKNQECMHEIQSLRELLSSGSSEAGAAAGGGGGGGGDSSGGGRRGHRRTPSYSLGHHRKQSLSSISRMIRMGSTIHEGDESEKVKAEELRLPAVATSSSPLENKLRKDIDTLLEENLEFWMKFSSSLQRVQEFQRKHDELMQQLQPAATDGNSDTKQKQKQEQQLRALKTELQVWSEQNAMLRGELQCRFAALCDVQEEITAALEQGGGGGEFTSYQAAKFQGEVLNMQQENNRVSDELHAGQDHVKGLQAQIEKKLQHGGVTLPDADGPAAGAATPPPLPLTRVASKSKVPLQSFLFPAKAKKPSLLARVTPVLQKQQPDLRFLAKLQPR
uniref:NAB domain-containing protein n=1 Tax=Oryza nivara TaxID=4536 RepID=A0A0E0FZM7_ORYNI